MAGIIVDVNAKTTDAERSLARIDNTLGEINQTAKKTTETISKTIKNIAAITLSSISVGQVTKISTEFTNLGNRIAIVTGRTKELTKAQNELYKIAIRTRSSISNTVETFGILGRNLQTLGVSQRKILQVTETIQKTAALSGQSMDSVKSAIIQFGQGLGQGYLRGQELLTVLEQMSPLARAIAEGMDVPYAALKRLGEEGKLTNDVIFSALLKSGASVDKQFLNVQKTFEQAGSQLKDSLKLYIFELDKGLNLSGGLANIFDKWSIYLRKAIENAQKLGATLNIALNSFKGNLQTIGRPIISLLKAIGTEVWKVFPRVLGGNTLASYVKESIRKLNDEFGGKLRIFAIDFITIENDVEKAVKYLKRLNPKYWIAGGASFDTLTFSRIFSKQTLLLVANRVQNFADKIREQFDTIFAVAERLAKVGYILGKFGKEFFSFDAGFFVVEGPGDFQKFKKLLSNVLNALFDVQVRTWEVRRLLHETFSGSGVALGYTFEKLREKAIENLKAIVIYLKDVFINILRGLNILPEEDTIGNYFKKVRKDLKNEISTLFVSFKNAFKSFVLDNKYTKGIKKEFDSILDSFNNFEKTISNWINDFASLSLGEQILKVFEIGSAWFVSEETLYNISQAIDNFLENFKDILSSIKDYSISKELNKLFDFNKTIDNAKKKLLPLFEITKRFTEILHNWKNEVIGEIFDIKQSFKDLFDFGDIEISFSKIDFSDLITVIDNITKQLSLEEPLQKFKDFKNKIINIFKEIYDKIIGHSYWTDTISAIKDSSQSIVRTTLISFGLLSVSLLNIFQNVLTFISKLVTLIVLTIGLLVVSIRRVFSSGADNAIWTANFVALSGAIAVTFRLLLQDILDIVSTGFNALIVVLDAIVNYVKAILNPIFEFAKAIGNILLDIFNFRTSISNLGMKLTEVFEPFLIKLRQVKEYFSNAQEGWENFVFSLRSRKIPLIGEVSGLGGNIKGLTLRNDAVDSWIKLKGSNFQSTLRAIRNFGKSVINVFKDIYEKVIGHSYWTDTVDNIIETSRTLWQKTKAGLYEFRDRISEIFEGIHAQNIPFVNKSNKTKPFLLKTNFAKVREDFFKILSDFYQGFVSLWEELPRIAKSFASGLGFILVSLIFPIGIIKKVLLTGLAGIWATNTTLFSESLGLAFTGGSLLGSAGRAMGIIAGDFTAHFLRQMPELISGLLAAVSAFVRGFISELPLIGRAFKVVFAIAEGFEFEGPLGTIGAFFFGKGVLKILAAFGILSKPINNLLSSGNALKGLIKGTSGGFISKYFFGTLGPARALSSIALVLDYMGVFDSLFVNDKLLKIIAEGGLLYLLFTGQEGYGKILKGLDFFLVAAAQQIRKKLSGTAFAISFEEGALVKTSGLVQLQRIVRSVFKNLGDILKKFKTTYIAPTLGLIGEIFVGKDPAKSFATLRRNIAKGFSSIFVKNGIPIKKIKDILKNLFNVGEAPGVFISIITTVFSTLRSMVVGLAALFLKITPQGLIGTALFGKIGVSIILLAILTLFSSIANASTDTSEKVTGNFTKIQQAWKNFSFANPFLAALTQIAVFTTVSVLLLTTWRGVVVKIFNTAFDTVGTILGINRIGAALSGLALTAASIFSGLKLYDYFVKDIELKKSDIIAIGATIAGWILFAFRSKIIKGIQTIISGGLLHTLGAIGGIATIVGSWIAASLGVGLFSVWLFGPNKEFFKDVDWAIENIRRAVTYYTGLFKKPVLSIDTELPKDLQKLATGYNLDLDVDVEKLNKSRFNDQQLTRYNNALNTVVDTLKRVQDEEDAVGVAASGTVAAADTAIRQYKNTISRLLSETAYNIDDFQKKMEQYAKGEAPNIFKEYTTFPIGSLVRSARRAAKDIAFAFAEASAGLFNVDDVEAFYARLRKGIKLEELNEGNAILSDIEKQVIFLEGAFEKLEYVSPEQEEQLTRLFGIFKELEEELQDKRLGLFGNRIELPDTDPLLQEINHMSDLINHTMQQAVDEGLHQKAVRVFQKELGVIEEAFSKVGLTFDLKMFDGINQNIWESVKNLAAELIKLEKDLGQAVNPAERLVTQENIKKVQRGLDALLVQGATLSNVQKQPLLTNFAESLKITVFPEDVYNQLDDKVANEMFELLSRIRIDTIGLAAHEIGTFDYKQASKNIELQALNFINAMIAASKNQVSTIMAIANDLGVDIFEAINNQSVDTAIKKLLSAQSHKVASQIALSTGDIATAAKEDAASKNTLNTLSKAPNTINDVLSKLSGIGSPFTIEDLGVLGSKDIASLKRISQVMDNIETKIKNLKNGFSDLDIKKILEEKFKAANESFEIFLKTLASTPKKVIESLGRFGLVGYDRIGNINAKTIKEFLELDKSIQILENQLANMPYDDSSFNDILAKLTAANKKAEELKNKIATFDEALRNVNDILKLDFNPQEFANLDLNFILELSTDANRLEDILHELNAKSLADLSPEELQQIRQILLDRNQNAYKAKQGSIAQGAELQANLDNIQFLSNADKAAVISKAFEGFASSEDILKNMNTDKLNELTRLAYDKLNEINALNYNVAGASLDDIEKIGLLAEKSGILALNLIKYGSGIEAGLNDFGISLEDGMINLLNTLDGNRLLGKLFEAQSIRSELASNDLSNARRKELQEALISKKFEMEDIIAEGAYSVARAAREAGEQMSNAVRDGFMDSMKNLLKGSGTLRDFVKSVLDVISNSILDAFIEGLLSPVTREGGIIDKIFKKLGNNIFGGTSKITGKSDGTKEDDTSGIVDAVKASTDAESGFFSELGSTFKSSLGNLGNLFLRGISGLSTFLFGGSSGNGGLISGAMGTVGAGILDKLAGVAWGFFGAGPRAEGGLIRGMGTAVSDSIPAMLSNGEFVINAKATRKHLALLTAINAGQLSGFAAGGLASASMMSTPTYSEINANPSVVNNTKAEQVFNINITGDISRQTRAHIITMLPQIAGGVSKYNHEKLRR